MGLNKNMYVEALEIKKNAKLCAERLAEEKKRIVYNTFSRLSEIDRELYANGSQIAFAALSKDSVKINALKDANEQLLAEKAKILDGQSLEPQYDCSLCSDSGYINGVLCNCVKDIAKNISFKQLSSKMPLTDCTFDNFSIKYYPESIQGNAYSPKREMEHTVALSKKFCENFSSAHDNLLFLGGVGLGKTHLSLAIANKILEQGFGVIYGSCQDLMMSAQNDYFTNNSNDTIENYCSCDLLIIDDLGTEMKSPFNSSLIYHIINTRLLRNLSTVINTNLSIKEIEERYTARVASRLMGNYIPRMFTGNDIRQIKG